MVVLETHETKFKIMVEERQKYLFNDI